ncbi:hypothetical protein [Sinorhizobium meliloti]|uniref:hypothetical protein n=1 Tax=Rhizobium meliloti TaxID=382 RepID=UPI00039A7575|nr:hypothetical protein [Sinorhizobium meliloti]
MINLTYRVAAAVTSGGPDYGVTNVRNLECPLWRGWTGVKNRCLLPCNHLLRI